MTIRIWEVGGHVRDSWHVTVPAREKYAIHQKEQGSTNPVPE